MSADEKTAGPTKQQNTCPKTPDALRGGASRVLDADEQLEEVEQPTLAQALSSSDENYGYARRFGTKDASCPEQFPAPVTSWDAHVYFDSSNAESTRSALMLREQTYTEFPQLTVNRPYRSPIGPHPTAMWSCELHTPAQMAQVSGSQR